MSQYKLTYFNLRARAELIRLIFVQAGVDYEDRRIAKEEWGELKPKTPYGSLPTLEVDGKVLAGSLPIARFVAERHGLAGSNDLENTEIAGILDCLGDLLQAFIKVLFESDETRKAELKKKFDEEESPKYFSLLEKRVTADGWLYGSKVTYADLAFFNFCDNLSGQPNLLEKYPGLKSVQEKVGALPNIAKWLKDRPVTPF